MTTPAVVLVVDDDETSIAAIHHLLEPEFQVISCISGARALELLPEVQPDLILLDIVMPDMDGYTLCAQLKGDPATASIPIIFVTGLAEPDVESAALERGAADYISKPFNANVVRARVRNHVELKRTRDELFALAATDGLTGLNNRRAFDAALDREYARLARSNARLTVIMCDVDHFKAYNDIYGHIAGDVCLRSVAGVVGAEMLRSADLAARYGGEEFGCVLPEIDLAGGAAIAERIRTGIANLKIPHSGSKISPYVTASFGVTSALCSNDTEAVEIVKTADANLYRAKAKGRDRVVSA